MHHPPLQEFDQRRLRGYPDTVRAKGKEYWDMLLRWNKDDCTLRTVPEEFEGQHT